MKRENQIALIKFLCGSTIQYSADRKYFIETDELIPMLKKDYGAEELTGYFIYVNRHWVAVSRKKLNRSEHMSEEEEQAVDYFWHVIARLEEQPEWEAPLNDLVRIMKGLMDDSKAQGACRYFKKFYNEFLHYLKY